MPNLNQTNPADAARAMREAFASDDPKLQEQAWANAFRAIGQQVFERMKGDISLFQQQDAQALAKKGYRTLNQKQIKWYQKVIDAMKSTNPKQAFLSIVGTDTELDVMPVDVLEDVYRNLQQEHPLLSRINFTYVSGFSTKWILNNHTTQAAVWGSITDEVKKEITSALKVVDMKQNKLSCYAVLEKGMLDLGPVFLDNYIRTCMAEGMALAMETAVISGTGLNQPAGMDRDLGASSWNMESGWKQKEPVAVTSFSPAEYGALVAQLVKDETGKTKQAFQPMLICNTTDHLTKVMPATTLLTPNGVYVNNLFPIPTDLVISNAVPDGKAILGIPREYGLQVGKSARSGVIEYDDSCQFLEDNRVFKTVQYADGRAYDNTSFLLLDISALEPAYLMVRQAADVETA